MNKTILLKKQELANEIASDIKEAKSIVVFEYQGLTAVETTALRKKLHKEGAKLYILKNNILNRALENSNLKNLGVFAGPNATILSSGNEIAAFKFVNEILKDRPNLKFKVGFVDGSVINSNQLSQIASIPGREGLYAMFLSCLQGPIRNLLYGLKAVGESKQ